MRSELPPYKVERFSTAALIQQLGLAIVAYEGHMGDAPPSSWKRFQTIGGKARPYRGLMPPNNAINTGAECLLIALTVPVGGIETFRWETAQIANLDDDRVVGVPSVAFGERCREVVDGWGNPIVYIHTRDYGKTFKVRLKSGVVMEVSARINPATGEHYRKRTYQLFSLGPDGTPGTADDITNFKQP